MTTPTFSDINSKRVTSYNSFDVFSIFFNGTQKSAVWTHLDPKSFLYPLYYHTNLWYKFWQFFRKMFRDLISMMYNPCFSAKKTCLGDPARICPEFPTHLLGHEKWLLQQFRLPPSSVSTFFGFFFNGTQKSAFWTHLDPKSFLDPLYYHNNLWYKFWQFFRKLFGDIISHDLKGVTKILDKFEPGHRVMFFWSKSVDYTSSKWGLRTIFGKIAKFCTIGSYDNIMDPRTIWGPNESKRRTFESR